jgi:RNA polymerase nonessential primary-like sigma factor
MTATTSHVPLDPSLSFLGPLPRLTAHEEATLLRQVERARLEQATTHPDALVLEAGRCACTTLIAAGQRLVIYLAKRFLARSHSMTLSDPIQEGTLGLIQAIDTYASIQGYPYPTWVELKIKDALRTALYQRDRLIRLPARLIDASRRLQRGEPQLSLTLGRTPTTSELAQAMQMQERKLASLLYLEDYTPCSLHTPLADEEDENRLLLDCIPAPDLVLPAPLWQTAEQQQDAKTLEQRLPRLSQVQALLGEIEERERAVITLRYGLGDAPEEGRPLGYEEIGRRLALNPGHACLIERRALRKLRLALTYYTPAQAAARLGVRVQQLNQLVKRGKLTRQIVLPNTRRAHYLRDEVDALAAQGEPLAHDSLEAAYARLVAQGEQVSLAGLCQRTQLSGRVVGAFLRERQRGLLTVAPQP